ncbi:hypothetical protein [Orenia metallireducens]|uniref:hypothetical protein n=1 Tax=Orenia metallireducens TaxID=1413210 RepID=UPI0015E5A591|nr:hypothetical protein [Orenia metallireducens]
MPYKKLEIKTDLSTGELKKKIEENIEINMLKGSFFYDSDKKFKGTIIDNHFFISRIIKYKNSFLPIVDGVIHPDNSGSTIKITMRLNKFVLVFGVLWIGLMLINFLNPEFESLIIFAIFIFAYLLCMVLFNIEVKKASTLFENLINN